MIKCFFMEGLVFKISKKEKVWTKNNNYQLFFEVLSLCSLSFFLSILWSNYLHPTWPGLLPIYKHGGVLVYGWRDSVADKQR